MQAFLTVYYPQVVIEEVKSELREKDSELRQKETKLREGIDELADARSRIARHYVFSKSELERILF